MAEFNDPQTTAEPTPGRTEMQLRLVVETGLLLASERSLDVIVQAALDAGLKLSGAAFGAFFYNKLGDDGETYQLYKLAGTAVEAFAGFPMPRPTQIFAYTFEGKGVLRSDNIKLDPRYGHNKPLHGLPKHHIPVCSYLAVPVQGRSGEVLGGLFYGHPEAAQFDPTCEDLVATVAAQAAVAIENVRLTDTISREIAVTDQARQLQRDTVERLRQALDAGQLGTWTWDRATDLLDFDDRAAELFGVQPHQRITRTEMRARAVLDEDLQATPTDLRERLAEGGAYTAEYRIHASGGGIRWIAAKGLGIHAPGTSELTGMSGTVQDITVRKTQEATLRQSEKLAATGRLAATIAHEINNPLEAVTNLIYLCKTDPTVPPTIQRLLETADTELARVAQIAQQTLGFYRDTTRPTEIDLAALLASVVDVFSRKLLSKQLVCTLDVAKDLRIIALQGEIKQVFSNLLVNAIDASNANSTIRIRGKLAAYQGRPGVSVLMADQGSGIPENIRGRLFSPFFTTKQSTGTGLGLWVTRGILEKQGGSIGFRTRAERPPTGTIFRIFLPKELTQIESFGVSNQGFLQ